MRKIISHLPPKEEISFFRKDIRSFQIIQERWCPSGAFSEKTILLEHLKKISYIHVFLVFFEKDRLSFSAQVVRSFVREKGNIIFPDNTKKIIFQRHYFGKAIFSGRMEKEIMVLRAVNFTVLSEKSIIFSFTFLMVKNIVVSPAWCRFPVKLIYFIAFRSASSACFWIKSIAINLYSLYKIYRNQLILSLFTWPVSTFLIFSYVLIFNSLIKKFSSINHGIVIFY